MKNNKPFRSERSRPFSRSKTAGSKLRKPEETVRLPGDARPRRTAESKTSRAGEDARPRRFEKDAKPRRFDRDDKPRRFEEGGKSKPFYKGEKSFRTDKPRFGDKPKPAFRKAKTEQPHDVFRPAENTVLIWGMHAARAAFLNPKRRITRMWLTEGGQKAFEATQKEAREELLKRPEAKKLDRDELDKITPPGSVHQGIVIETYPLPDRALHEIIAADPPPDLILMLDQVTDPHNVGAILRSSAAFGAGALVMTERNAPTTTGVLAKSASGALEHVPMVHVVNLARALDELREAGYWCIGLAEEGEKTLGEIDMSGRTVLVLGNEGEGLRHLTRQKCDELAKLPTGGPVGSLNVSNAAAIGLYEVRRQGKK